MHAEVIGVDWAEQRIILPCRLHCVETGARRRWTQLKVLRRHVAVGARSTIPAEPAERPVLEVLSAAHAGGLSHAHKAAAFQSVDLRSWALATRLRSRRIERGLTTPRACNLHHS